jgi:hypothetical protein
LNIMAITAFSPYLALVAAAAMAEEQGQGAWTNLMSAAVVAPLVEGEVLAHQFSGVALAQKCAAAAAAPSVLAALVVALA